jgi:hypothetical protein
MKNYQVNKTASLPRIKNLGKWQVGKRQVEKMSQHQQVLKVFPFQEFREDYELIWKKLQYCNLDILTMKRHHNTQHNNTQHNDTQHKYLFCDTWHKWHSA